MPLLTCVKCGNTREAAVNNDYVGTKLGVEISQSVCVECWQEWEKMQLMVINEHKLTLFLKEHKQFLHAQMRQFLNLKPKEEPSS